MNPPLITAVMCTPGRGARRELAKIAVACFHRQTHPRKRLLILNHGLPLDIAQHPHVREIILGRPPTLGELRNQAFRYLETDDYAISWDDDDWYSPDRMGLQLTFIRHSGKKAAALYSYINVDIKTGEAFVRNCSHFQARCACGTMLYRVGTERYPAIQRREDSDFAMLFRRQGELAVCNLLPAVYIRLCHGENTSGTQKIMNNRTNRRVLQPGERAWVATALMEYVQAGCFPLPPTW
jgi:glycosyltransferase involved in cell wall biosynthesis